MLSIIKLVPPGSIGFLVVATAVGIVLITVSRTTRKVMRFALGLLYLSYLALATPRVANTLADSLPPVRQNDIGISTPLDAIIVLDGDNRRGRVRAVRQTEARSPAAPIVVLADAGDPWLVDNLIASGIPAANVTSRTGADTTRDQVKLAQEAVSAHSWHRVALVASRLQSPRVSALARGFQPPPTIISAAVDDDPVSDGVRALLPSYIALRISRDALYERAALMYYRWRGWI